VDVTWPRVGRPHARRALENAPMRVCHTGGKLGKLENSSRAWGPGSDTGCSVTRRPLLMFPIVISLRGRREPLKTYTDWLEQLSGLFMELDLAPDSVAFPPPLVDASTSSLCKSLVDPSKSVTSWGSKFPHISQFLCGRCDVHELAFQEWRLRTRHCTRASRRTPPTCHRD
jgi:hypothetical protein